MKAHVTPLISPAPSHCPSPKARNAFQPRPAPSARHDARASGARAAPTADRPAPERQGSPPHALSAVARGQRDAEPRRPPAGPASIDQRGLAARTSLSRQDPARRLPATPSTLCLPLSTYYLLILIRYLYYLDLARVARNATVFFEVLCEVMGRSIGPATISSPFSGAGALRVVYAPIACFSLDSFGRIGAFQRVTREKNKKILPVLTRAQGCGRKTTQAQPPLNSPVPNPPAAGLSSLDRKI